MRLKGLAGQFDPCRADLPQQCLGRHTSHVATRRAYLTNPSADLTTRSGVAALNVAARPWLEQIHTRGAAMRWGQAEAAVQAIAAQISANPAELAFPLAPPAPLVRTRPARPRPHGRRRPSRSEDLGTRGSGRATTRRGQTPAMSIGQFLDDTAHSLADPDHGRLRLDLDLYRLPPLGAPTATRPGPARGANGTPQWRAVATRRGRPWGAPASSCEETALLGSRVDIDRSLPVWMLAGVS